MSLQGFDVAYYLSEKLAELQGLDPGVWDSKTTTDVLNAIIASGQTAESNYTTYGYKEGLNPNAFFNATDYIHAKAQQLVAAGLYTDVAHATIAFVTALNGTDPYQHYLKYGAAEQINPSNNFNSALYLQAKLASLASSGAIDPLTHVAWSAETTANLLKYFLSVGLTPLTHYLQFGYAEHLSYAPVPAPVPGVTDTLTTSADNVIGVGSSTINGTIGYTFNTISPTPTFSTGDQISVSGTGNVLNLYDNNNLTHGGYTITPTSITGVSVSGVQTVNVYDNAALNFDATGFQGWAGLTNLNAQTISSHNNVDTITVGAGTAVNVADVVAENLHNHDNLTVNGGSKVTITEDNGSNSVKDATIIVNGGTGTTAVSVTQTGDATSGHSYQDVVITDVNHNGGIAAGVITTVVIDGLKGGATAEINDSSLTSLTVNNVLGTGNHGTPDVEIHNGGYWTLPETLSLNVNNDAQFTLSNYSSRSNYTALKVNVGPDGAAIDLDGFNSVITEAITGSGLLIQDPPTHTLTSLQTITIGGTAGFEDLDLYNLPSLSLVDASGQRSGAGTVTVVLDDTHTTFIGGAGRDIVSIQSDAIAAHPITGGSAANNEIILNGAGGVDAAHAGHGGLNGGVFTYAGTGTYVTGFTTLGVGEFSSGYYVVDSLFGGYDPLFTGINHLVVNAYTSSHALNGPVWFTQVKQGVDLTFTYNDTSFNPPAFEWFGNVTYQLSDTHGATDSVNINFNEAANTEAVHIKDLTLIDANGQGIGTATVNSLGGAVWADGNSINNLYDNGLTTLTVTGTEGLHIHQLYDNAVSLTINNNTSSSTGVLGTGLVHVDLWQSPNLMTLNLNGDVQIDGFETDAPGATVNGATDNANVHLLLHDHNVIGTDTITLGNGDNFITDTANNSGATYGMINVTVGSGSNHINLGSSSNYITLGSHAVQTADYITIGSSLITTGLNVDGNPTVTTLKAVTTITGINSSTFGSDTITFAGDPSATGNVIVVSGADIATYETAHHLANSSINDAVRAVLALDTTAHSIAEFMFGGDIYLLDNVAGGTPTNGTPTGDTLVHLVGVVGNVTSLSHASSGTLHLVG